VLWLLPGEQLAFKASLFYMQVTNGWWNCRLWHDTRQNDNSNYRCASLLFCGHQA